MRRVADSRRDHPDLLDRETSLRLRARAWEVLLVDPVAQLAELQDLVARGLVSPEELERQRSRIFPR